MQFLTCVGLKTACYNYHAIINKSLLLLTDPLDALPHAHCAVHRYRRSV